MIQTLTRFAKRRIVARNNFKLTGIPKVAVARVAKSGGPRLNIVLLAARKASLFGGADTALRLFFELAPFHERLRIIVILEDQRNFVASEWPEWQLGRDTSEPKAIVYTQGRSLPLGVEDNDVFIATHWMTALVVRNALAVQPAWPGRRFLYLLQDFEPGFYPWSGRYLLAQGTYGRTDDVVAVFNTQELAAYFVQSGLTFPQHFVFEPRLNPALAAYRDRLVGHPKRRLLLVYGRPGTPRNAFDIIVESLEIWAKDYPGAQDWEVVSLGEAHRDIRLSPKVRLRSGGKASLDDYARFLSDAAVGFSLMVSPHPSYPPLEMAAFGARVVTNTYGGKNLTRRSPLIHSVSETVPASFAEALREACEAFESGPGSVLERPPAAFLGEAEEFPFVNQLMALIRP